VVVADIDSKSAAEVVAEFGDAAVPVNVDVTKEESIFNAYREATLAFGASMWSSRTPASPRARRSPRPRSNCGTAITTSSPAATSSSPERRHDC
jgi:hypothetical protein